MQFRVSVMNSHHFIGVGLLSQTLKQTSARLDDVAVQISEMIVCCDLEIVSQKTVHFDNGGATLVWILAESHLVVHLWTREDFATVDLHVCDYKSSNLESAQRLRDGLDKFCFAPAVSKWLEFTLPQPTSAIA